MPKNHGGRGVHGKKYREVKRQLDREERYGLRDALEMVKEFSAEAGRGFDETIEVAFRLGIDPRKADEQIRGTVALPGGTGQDTRVAVFAAGDDAKAAEEAGADVVGADDLVEKVENGFLDFDVAIATPDLMSQVGKLGKVLGPRGLMPNPKSGTVTDDVAKAVGEFKGGMVEYRSDRNGNVHVPVGKASFEVGDLVENVKTLADEIVRSRPASAKGRYVRSITVSSTMGPGIKIDPLRIDEIEEMVEATTT